MIAHTHVQGRLLLAPVISLAFGQWRGHLVRPRLDPPVAPEYVMHNSCTRARLRHRPTRP